MDVIIMLLSVASAVITLLGFFFGITHIKDLFRNVGRNQTISPIGNSGLANQQSLPNRNYWTDKKKRAWMRFLIPIIIGLSLLCLITVLSKQTSQTFIYSLF